MQEEQDAWFYSRRGERDHILIRNVHTDFGAQQLPFHRSLGSLSGGRNDRNVKLLSHHTLLSMLGMNGVFRTLLYVFMPCTGLTLCFNTPCVPMADRGRLVLTALMSGVIKNIRIINIVFS